MAAPVKDQDQVQDDWSPGWGHYISLLSKKKKTAETDTYDTDTAVPEARNESIIDPITRVHGDPGEEVVVDSVRARGSPDASGTNERFREV